MHANLVFCSDNWAGYSEENFVHFGFWFFPSYRSRKKGTEEKFFEAKEKLKSEVEKFFPKNRMLFTFVWLFGRSNQASYFEIVLIPLEITRL